MATVIAGRARLVAVDGAPHEVAHAVELAPRPGAAAMACEVALAARLVARLRLRHGRRELRRERRGRARLMASVAAVRLAALEVALEGWSRSLATLQQRRPWLRALVPALLVLAATTAAFPESMHLLDEALGLDAGEALEVGRADLAAAMVALTMAVPTMVVSGLLRVARLVGVTLMLLVAVTMLVRVAGLVRMALMLIVAVAMLVRVAGLVGVALVLLVVVAVLVRVAGLVRMTAVVMLGIMTLAMRRLQLRAAVVLLAGEHGILLRLYEYAPGQMARIALHGDRCACAGGEANTQLGHAKQRQEQPDDLQQQHLANQEAPIDTLNAGGVLGGGR